MADHQMAVIRNGKYPFLTLVKPRDGQKYETLITLTGDEIEDYEETALRWSDWQERLSEAG